MDVLLSAVVAPDSQMTFNVMIPTVGKVILHKASVALIIALSLLHLLLWGTV